jgi:hypothetical protein
MHRYFEYCRFTTVSRGLQSSVPIIRSEFAKRAGENGGSLFGCWRSMVGLGLARDEGIALSAWPDEAAARTAGAPQIEGLVSSNRHFLKATVRPTDDIPPTYEGVYVFRWFDIEASDWEAFRDISNAAWPNMEEVFDVNICGFWRSLDVANPASKVLLLTRYADLSVWEASRWWNKPTTEADASMSRFKKRNDMIKATVAYPSLPIF